MVQIPLSAGLILVTVGWILFRLFISRKNGHLSVKNELLQLLFLINLLVLYRMTFHPFETLNGKVQPLVFDIATAWPFRTNLIPFVNLTDYDSRRDLLLNIIGNCAMFIPTGILTPILYKNRNNFFKVVTTGFLISLAIEIIQLPFAVRCSDVDDLILNTIGTIIGYGIYALATCRKRSGLRAK